MSQTGKIVESEATLLADYSSSYERVRPRLDALRRDELIPIKLDIPTAVMTALGAAPEVRALRDAIVRDWPTADMELIDGLADIARALMHTHNRSKTDAGVDATDLMAMAEEVAAIRKRFIIDAQPLVHRGFVNAGLLRGITNLTGYRNLASDVMRLVEGLRNQLAAVQAHSAITEEELAQAFTLADGLLSAAGMREQADPSPVAWSIERVRMFTLFMQAYVQSRHAVQHVRWREGDADKIIPSLYNRRTSKRRTVNAETPSHTTMPAITEHTEVTDA
jgi:hypothetical protein